MLSFFILAALAYGAASYAFASEPEQVGKFPTFARKILIGAGILHVVYIGSQCLEGHHPFTSIFSVLSLGALLALAGYLLISRKRSMDSLGAVLAPIALVSLALEVIFTGAYHPHDSDPSFLAKVHIGLATAGLAGFTLAAGVAGVYLGMERRLRKKRFKPPERAVSLIGLDRLHYRIVLLVTPIFTLAMVTGIVWILRLGDFATLGSRWFEILVSFVVWLASMTLVVMRVGFGMRGRKSAWLTLLAFSCTVVVVVYYGIRI